MKLEENKKKFDQFPFSAQSHPWLVILHGQKLQKQTFYSISENRCAYAHGWLVLLDYHSDNCYLWNPSSNDKIQLPPLPKYKSVECLLSAPPHDPECHVVFLIKESNDDTDDDTDDDDDDEDDDEDTPPILYFCKPEKSWIEVESIGETAIFLDAYGGMSCSTRGTNLEKESIYFTEDDDRCLHVFNLKTKTITTCLPCQHVSKKHSTFNWLPL
ncbi:hypothetical protein KY284_035277 [Solanum tuberosum]|nr:hypothetical protein KY284_035277 [Solanum tuberosum]